MAESKYQARLIKKLKRLYPGCFILKNDEQYLQGIPDLIVLHGGRWAVLEVKDHKDSPYQPNQEWYLELLNGMWFASVIYPEIEKEVLNALHAALSPG